MLSFFSQMKISYKFKQGRKLQDFYFELIFILLPHQYHFSFIRLFWDIVRAYFVYTNILLYLFATYIEKKKKLNNVALQHSG